MLCTYMSSLVVQLLRLLHPPLDWKCRTLSLRLTFFIWVHITMSVDSVEKSISNHCYSNSQVCLHVYKTDIMRLRTLKHCQTNFAIMSSLQLRKMVATQSIPNADKTLQTTYDIILLCVLGTHACTLPILLALRNYH